MTAMVQVAPGITIPAEEIEERFIQSGGPGGQNVNKVATTVQLRFDAAGSPSLAPEVRRRLLRIAGTRVTSDGELVLTARRFRTQEANRRDARERLAALVAQALAEPRPRQATRPTRAARERRLQDKARRATVKRQRGQPDDDD